MSETTTSRIREVPLVCGHTFVVGKDMPSPGRSEIVYCRRCELWEYAFAYPPEDNDGSPWQLAPHEGECPGCGRTKPILKNGNIETHNLSGGASGTYVQCEGSRQRPINPRPIGTGEKVVADTGPSSVVKFQYRYQCLHHAWFGGVDIPGDVAMKRISKHFDRYDASCPIEYSTVSRSSLYGRNNEERKRMRAARKLVNWEKKQNA